MSTVLHIGKFLDQPLLVSRFSKSVPVALGASAIALGVSDVRRAPEGEKKKTFIRNLCVLSFTVASALIATRGLGPIKIGGKQIFKGFKGLIDIEKLPVVRKAQTELVETFVKGKSFSPELTKILEKAKTKVLNFSEIKTLYKGLGASNAGTKFLANLIPDPKKLGFRDIFNEIGKLSLMGLIPVLGGIAGGITGDILTHDNWNDRWKGLPNKVKEGFYQYFANIFLCNVGAATALGIMEKRGVTSKSMRAMGMVGGILAMGVIGGSFIANFLGKKIINPIFDKKGESTAATSLKDIYSERKPEALDIGLHVDDIATVAVMSGLSWIEPSLPILYSVSGYRAGIGYRNGHKNKHGHKNERSHKNEHGPNQSHKHQHRRSKRDQNINAVSFNHQFTRLNFENQGKFRNKHQNVYRNFETFMQIG